MKRIGTVAVVGGKVSAGLALRHKWTMSYGY